jgi:hypothetical protein
MSHPTPQRPEGKPLSALIREGAKLRPKCTGTFFEEGRSCAIGAALEASGVAYNENGKAVSQLAAPLFPEIFEAPNTFTALGREIYRENDSLGGTHMTREEIADLLEARGL